MKAQIHFRDALEWIAKAPPLLELESSSLSSGVVLPFPLERVRHGRKGLAEGKGR
jgi:hypothetical protein